jgi:hypothetical protein
MTYKVSQITNILSTPRDPLTRNTDHNPSSQHHHHQPAQSPKRSTHKHITSPLNQRTSSQSYHHKQTKSPLNRKSNHNPVSHINLITSIPLTNQSINQSDRHKPDVASQSNHLHHIVKHRVKNGSGARPDS